MATKVQLQGGAFQDSKGNLLALGYLIMKLSQDGVVSGTGQICSGVEIKITLNSSGGVDTSAAQSVWGNDQMLPANSYYRVFGFNAAGQLAWGPNNQQVNGSGGTFDVGTWTPNTVISWTPPLQPLALKTNSVANGSQTLLNLKSGTNATVADDGVGGVTISASSPNANPGLVRYSVPQFQSPTTLLEVPTNAWSMLVTNNGAVTTAVVPTTATVPAYVKRTCAVGVSGIAAWAGTAATIAPYMLKSLKQNVFTFGNTSVRRWIGLTNDLSPGSGFLAFDNPNRQIIALRYSSAVDSFWTAYCSTDNTHFTTAVTSVVPDTTGAEHIYEIQTVQGTPGTILFLIDGVQVASINSANVPASTTFLTPLVYNDNTAGVVGTASGWNLTYFENFPY